MKKRIKLVVILSCVFMLCIAAFVLSSCTLKTMTKDDLIKDGYSYTVTFDYNGGKAGNFESIELQVKPNDICFAPGSITSGKGETYLGKAPTRTGYVLDGYYLGDKDENGVVTLDKKWDFKKDTVTENITLYAKWRKAYSLVINYVDNNGDKKTESVTVDQEADGTPRTVQLPSISGYTAIGFYREENYQSSTEINFPFTPTTDELHEEKTELEIYANVLYGRWTVVKSENEFKSINDGTNIYLLCNIDMNKIYGEDVNWDVDWSDTKNEETQKAQAALDKFTMPKNYVGNFYGNGYTISNLRLRREQNDNRDNDFGLFKTLESTAVVKDITFENVNLYVNLSNKAARSNNVGMLAGRAREGAVIQNVNITGKIECDVVTDNGIANNTEVYPFLGDDMMYCTPENCDYSGVTVIKNGETVDWKATTPEPDTAE